MFVYIAGLVEGMRRGMLVETVQYNFFFFSKKKKKKKKQNAFNFSGNEQPHLLAYQLNRLGKKCRAGLDERVITVITFM